VYVTTNTIFWSVVIGALVLLAAWDNRRGGEHISRTQVFEQSPGS